MSERIRLGVALSELGRDSKRQRVRTPGNSRNGSARRERLGSYPPQAPDGAPTKSELDGFCRALSDATNLPIVPYAAPRYDRLLHRLKVGEIELAWLAPVVALEALRQGIVPVVLPLRGSTPWFWTALFVREDSSIQSLADLPGAHAVWVDRESASGYLVIRASLRGEGVDIDRVFAAETFAGAHDAAVRAVMSDRKAVGATYVHLDSNGGFARAGWGRESVRVLRTAGPIPSDVLAASPTLGATQIARVRDALVSGGSKALTQATSALFAARGFLAAERPHLAHLEMLGRYLIRA
jgi:phosphonate transport system substrate-binding protein